MPMALSIQITKLKFHQYQLRANLPNLMLTEDTRYMLYGCPLESQTEYPILCMIPSLSSLTHTHCMAEHTYV